MTPLGERRSLSLVLVGCLLFSPGWSASLALAGSPATGTLVVFAADSATSKPIRGVGITVRPPGWYWSETHQEPDWFATTDGTGWARLRKIPVGNYEASFCENTYERRMTGVEIVRNRVDSLRVRMLYLGPPRDGRRCEIRFEIPKSLLKKLQKRGR